MKKYLVTIPILAVIGRSLGLLIPFVVAWRFGAGHSTDVFFWIFSFVMFITNIMTYLFESVLVPNLSEQKINTQTAADFANAVLYFILPVILLLCVVFGVFLSYGVISPGGPQDTGLGGRIFWLLIPFLLAGIWASQSNGLLIVHKNFWFSALSPLLRSFVVILFILGLGKAWGVYALAAGFSAGEGLRWAAGLFLLKRSINWSFSLHWEKVRPSVRIFFKGLGLQLLALTAVNAVFFTDLSFAIHLGEGDASLLNYADKMYQIPFLFFQAGFLDIFNSFWSESFYKDKRERFWIRIRRHTGFVMGVSVAVGLILWASRNFLVLLFFNQKSFAAGHLTDLANLFGLLSLALAPSILNALLVRILFILKRNRVYFGIALFQLFGKIILNGLLVGHYGVQGLAISTLVITSLTAAALCIYLVFYAGRETVHG